MAGELVLLEKELKYELSKSDYLKLIRVLKPKSKKRLQLTNYYFDDSSLTLRKKKYALRIRISHNGTKETVLFTLKYPGKQPKNAPRALKVRVEHEVLINRDVAKRILNKRGRISDVDLAPMRILRRHFTKSELSKVRPLGLIQTRRTVVPLPGKLELEIDRCKVFDKKFYEVEVETSSPRRADREIKILLESHGIPYLPITRSKFARFLGEWKRRNP